MIDAELARPVKKEPAVEYAAPKLIFSKPDANVAAEEEEEMVQDDVEPLVKYWQF